jgi:hypothetical protein
MSKKSPRPSNPHYEEGELITDPAELAAIDEQYRKDRKTALYQIGCWNVVDVPLPLLAQYIAELPAEDQQGFAKELVERLPAEAFHKLGEAMKARLGRGAV